MASHYSVVQYLPDPVTDERINIGAIVIGEGVLRSRFLVNWNRVKHFGAEDITFLKDFADKISEFEEARLPLQELNAEPRFDLRAVERLAGSWLNSIQLTPPRASLREPDDLLQEITHRFLREPARRGRQGRDRRAAAGLAARHLFSALAVRIGERAKDLVKRNIEVQGRLDTHKFDVSVGNSVSRIAVQGLSFEVPDSKDLNKDIEATAWAIDDVKQSHPEFPIAVVLLRRATESRTYARASRVFQGLNATIVEEPMLKEWATKIAARVEPLG